MARPGYVALLFAALAAGLLAPRAGAQRPGRSVAVDTALLEIRIGDAASGLVEAYRRSDSAVVSLRDVLTIAGLDAPIAGQPLVSASELAARLRADVVLDWSALTMFVADSGTLPVSRRAARARARAALRARDVSPIVAPTVRSPRAPSALALDYVASRDGGVALDVGTRAVGGAIDAGIGGLAARAANTLRIGWESLPVADVPALRWRLGTLDELGGRLGIRLTNGPVLRPDSIGVIDLAAAGAPGADVDVYVDGALVATDTVAGDGTVRLHAMEQRGEHQLRMIAYAPDGRERVLARRRIVTPDALLPAHAVRYAVAVSPCARARCSVLAGQLRFAPTDRVTLGAAVQARTRRSTAVTLSLDARVADAIVLAASTDPVTGTRVDLRRDGGDGTGIVLRSSATRTRARVTSLSGAWRIAPAAFARAEIARADSGWRAAAGATFATRIGTVTPTVAMAESPSQVSSVRWNADALLVGAGLPRMAGALRRALMRAHATAAATGLLESMATLVLPVSPLLALEASVAWHGEAVPHRRVISLSLRRRLSAATVRMTAEAGGIAPVGTEEASGSLVIDAVRRRVMTSADPLAGRAGVHGRVFVDRDGDGRYGAGDEPMPGVAVRIGGTAALTDADGGFEAWDLAPYGRVVVEVDSLTIDGDRLAAPTAMSVQPTPHALAWIDVPVRPRASVPVSGGGGG